MATDTDTTRGSDRQSLDDTMSMAEAATPKPDDTETELQQAIGNVMPGDDARAHENIHQGAERMEWGTTGQDMPEGGAPPADTGYESAGVGTRGAPDVPASSIDRLMDNVNRGLSGDGSDAPPAPAAPQARATGDGAVDPLPAGPTGETAPPPGIVPGLSDGVDTMARGPAGAEGAPGDAASPDFGALGATEDTPPASGGPEQGGADEGGDAGGPTGTTADGPDQTETTDPPATTETDEPGAEETATGADDGDTPAEADPGETGAPEEAGDTGGTDTEDTAPEQPASDDNDDGAEDDTPPEDIADDGETGEETGGEPPAAGDPDVRFTLDNSQTWTPDFEGDDTVQINESGTTTPWGAEVTADTDASGDGKTSIEVDKWNKAKSVLAEGEGGADVTVDNFVHAEVRLGDGGDSTVTITDAKRGAVETGDGNDVVDIDALTNNAGWDNTFRLDTGSGDDSATVTGSKGHTRVVADMGAGDDSIVVDGQTKSADLTGGAGNDTLISGAGDDVLDGGTGDDVLDGGSGADTVNGGAGDDLGIVRTADRTAGGGEAHYDGGDGTDTLRVEVDDANLTNGDVLAEMREMREAIKAGDGGEIAVDSIGLTVSDWEGTAIVDSEGNAVDLDADGVTVSTKDALGAEDTAVALDIKALLADQDGSETLSVDVSGVPEDARLSAGTRNEDGTWTLTADDLDGLSVSTAENWNGTLALDVTATGTELSGHSASATESLSVEVAAVNDGPVISGLENIIRVTNVNDLVYKHTFDSPAEFPDLSENKRLDPDKVNGVDPDNLTLKHDHDVSVTFVSEGAGYHNALGWYTVEESGTLGNPQFIYGDATDTVIDKAGTETVSLTPPEDGFAGKTLGFFLVANGHNKNKESDFWDDAANNEGGKLAFVDDTGAPATVNTPTPKLVFVGDDGSVHEIKSQGGIYHSTAANDTTGLNPDDLQHAISGVTDDGDSLMVGFEDLKGLGDHDFNDLVFKVNVGAENARQLVPTAAAPGIQIKDVDSPMMAGAEARLSEGMCVGDELHLNGVTVNEDGTIGDTGVTMEVVQDDTGYAIRFSGEADQATYTDLLSRVKLQNSGTEPELGDRFVDFTVEDGQARTTARATVRVTDEPNPSDIILDPAAEDPGANALGAEAPAVEAEGLGFETAGLSDAMASGESLAKAGADETEAGPVRGRDAGPDDAKTDPAPQQDVKTGTRMAGTGADAGGAADSADQTKGGGTTADAPANAPQADDGAGSSEFSTKDADLESTVLFDLEELEDTDDGSAWTDSEGDGDGAVDGGWTDTVEGGGDANADPQPDLSDASHVETGTGSNENEVFCEEAFV